MRACTDHGPACEWDAPRTLLELAGLVMEEVHLGGGIIGLQLDTPPAFAWVTRNGERGYEVGWYGHPDAEDPESYAEEQTIRQVVEFLRAQRAVTAPSTLFGPNVS